MFQKLDDDRIDCHFGDGKCKILVDNKCVGLAFRQDKLYLLSLSENMNDVSTENENASSSMNEVISGREFMMYHQNYGTIG